MSALSERIAALSPKQRELLERRVKRQQLEASTAGAIPRRREQNFVPLSFAQQRLWFLDQLEPGTSLYNLPTMVRLTGELNIDALQQSFNEIVSRHENLRTTFAMIDEQSVQIIAPELKLPLPVFDLASLPTAEREKEAAQLAGEEAKRPFDLGAGPLLRAALLRLSAEEHILILTMHHIISDGWSMGVLVGEVATLYEAFCAGKPSPLPELSIQYADYAMWQREWLQGEVLEQQVDYWKSQLAGAETLQLPTDFQRPGTKSYRGARYGFKLPASLSEAIHAVSRKEGATVFMTLLAAFQTLLYRYTGQPDISVGTPLAGRTRVDTEQLIGFFVNTLVLRTQLSGDESFTELLRRVKEMTLSAQEHQDVPFEKLVDELQPERNLSHSPLFQTVFVLQNNPTPSANMAGLRLESLAVEGTTSKFDLNLIMDEAERELQGFFEYSTDLFAAATIERMAAHFQNLLESIVNNPDSRLSELPLLSEAERQQLLVEWNPPAQSFNFDNCLHQLFEQQASLNPQALALIYGEERLTYGELSERANQIAHHLQALGVRADSLVGIMMERSLEMVIGLLGILKAGGAYVPLDPGYPKERLAFMLEDSGAQFLLTQQSLVDALPEHNAQVVILDSDREAIAACSKENPVGEATSDHLAYVIYTSGSTGRPKGVLVTHANVTRLLTATEPQFRFGPSDVVTMFHSYAFDFSVWELWSALAYGGRLVIVPYWISRSPADFAELLMRERVTVLSQTPSAFRQLIHLEEEAGESTRLSPDNGLSLRVVIFGGEALEVGSLRGWFERHGDTKPVLVNMYGITETTVHVTYRELGIEDVCGGSVIGRAIGDLRIYVLDQEMEVVPIGVSGELYVGGDGLARGYLNRADLTAERFVPDPFSAERGHRLYRSGDVVRWRADGELEYLGRADEQVKIRGFRIELGEIEAVLSDHPDVREAAVVTAAGPDENQRLIGYIVPHSWPVSLPIDSLRQWLEARLPAYMIPSAFVMLEQLPLTMNGKLDRRALPAPEPDRLRLEQGYVAPRTQVEATLAVIWEDVLRVERVGVADNFFELGGDSILILQIVARASRAGLRLTPKLIFEHQSISELEPFIAVVGAPQADQGPVIGDVPLTPIQRRFFSLGLPEPHHYNQSVLLETAEIDPELMRQAVSHLLRQHDALRLRFTRDENVGWRQHNAEQETSEVFSHHDWSELGDKQLGAAIEERAETLQRSLNLEAGPLVRIALFDYGGSRGWRLLVVVHHLCVDGVSWRVLLEDLQSAYEQLARDEAVELGAKTSSYQRWSKALTEYAQSETVQAELGYWLTDDRRDVAQLPVDFEAGKEANTQESIHTIEVKLGVEETQLLLKEVPQAYQTQINDVLLTALGQTLPTSTGDSKILVDLEGHGREEISADIDVSRTVGWFTSIFPVLLEARREESLGEALKRTKEQLREIPQRGLGYGLLRYLSGEATALALDSLPQAEVSFNYLGQFDQVVSSESMFRGARESAGRAMSEHGQRSHALEIDAVVTGGALQVNWSYSRNLHRSETIESLARNYFQSLRELIEHCRSAEAGGRTPSDFPLAHLSRQELDRIVERDRKIENIYPLSPVQQGMLFHTLFAPESGAYLLQLSYEVDGQLDVATLKRSWQAVIDRHTILRTAFVWEDLGGPLQVIRRDARMPVEQEDWRELKREEQQQQLAAYLAADRQRSFDLGEAPLMRLSVIRLAEEKYFVTLSHHHILVDGWSMVRLLREVFTFYESFVQGNIPHMEPSRPYSEYIAWLQKQDPGQAEPFWRENLRGFTTPTALPTSLAEKGSGEHAYADQEIALPRGTAEALRALARRERITLNTIMQTAWALLLTRYSGEEDVVFGVTVSGRPTELAGIESMLGLFINTLPLRLQLRSDETVIQTLHDVHARQVEMLQYQHSPLVEVQRWSDLEPGMPLFESILVFENYPVEAALRQQEEAPNGPRVRDARVKEQNNYPLSVMVAPGEQILVKMTYQQERFDRAIVGRMLGHLQTVLEEIGRDARQRLRELPLLTAEEHHQLLFEWNDTKTDYAAARCLHELFEDQVERTPDHVAVIYEGAQLTYRQLNEGANQLAHYLQSSGVGPDVYVGIYLERSLEMVIALLGVLKAGGAYLPLDPMYPKERLSFMLQDTAVAVLVTQERFVNELPQHQAHVVSLDAEREAIALHHSSNPDTEVSIDNLAYIIYTSGSTGRPKGAMIPHRAIVNHMLWMRHAFPLTSEDRILQKTPFSFDASIWEFYAPLLEGAALVMAQPGVQQDSSLLAEVLNQERITVLQGVPSLLRVLVQEETLSQCRGKLKRVFSGGEALTSELAEAWRQRTGAEVFNLYGPTETAIDMTVWPYEKSKTFPGQILPLGRPIPNAEVYILDNRGEPVPAGVAGELHVGGVQLGRGYLNRPALTGEKFIPDRFSGRAGARLYKSGDLVRYWSDGTIEFLGRMDFQVKVRGFRIELGEIEAVLSQHPAVQQTAVVALRYDEADLRLVAYLSLAQGAPALGVKETRQFLIEHLPDYMVPHAFVFLAEMPLMPSGKVDRKRLPAPEHGRQQLDQSYVAPRNAIEEALASIWREVLGVEQVGIEDNFFELGGDSILSLQIVARASRAGLRLSPKLIFENQSISELATVTTAASVSNADQELVTGEVGLTPIQHRFFSLDLPEPHHFNQSVLFEMSAPIDSALMRQAVSELLKQHDALRLRFIRDERGEWHQSNSEHETSEIFSVHDLSALADGELIPTLEAQADQLQRSLNLEEGPLVRVALFECGEAQAQRLLMVIHHLCVDGVSWRVLLEDLQSAYEQLARDERVELGAKTTSYQRWSAALNEYAHSESVQSERSYWQQVVSGEPGRLPVDYDDGPNRKAATETLTLKLGEAETLALLQEVPQAYRTQINDVLLTALAEACARWTGNSQTLVNLEGHGREEIGAEIDVSRTVGWFTSIFPVLLEARREDSLGEALKRTKEQLRAIPQRGLGYGLLRYLTAAESGLALDLRPQAEVSFNYLGQFDQVLNERSLFRATRQTVGRAASEQGEREHLLDINAMIAGGQLQISWSYSSEIHRAETIERLAQNYLAALQQLIGHCLREDAGGYTPSDFPLARLEQQELNLVVGGDQQIENIYPLSPMQQGMLFHTLFAPESGVYVIQLSYEVEGELDLDALRRAWAKVIGRHAILRTSFVWDGLREPVQVVHQEVEMPCVEQDWSSLPKDEQQQRLDVFLAADRQQGIALSRAPLLRLSIIRLGDGLHVVTLSQHHLLLDGWGAAIVLKEVFAYYDGFRRGQLAELEPSRPYGDYIEWLQRQDLGQAEHFWRQTLGGFTALTPLPEDRTASGTGSDEQTFRLSPAITDELKNLARRERVTLNTIMQCAWALLLSRYSGEDDVVFGVTVSGRPAELPGIESMLGLFINTLPLRVSVPGQKTITQCLREVHASQVELQQYEYSPLVEVRRWSDLEPGTPLFESILIFENYPVESVLRQQAEESGGTIKARNLRTKEQNNYPLSLTVVPEESLRIEIAYQRQRFEPATVRRMLGHLQTVLEEIAFNSERQVHELPILTAAEKKQQLYDWTATQIDYPRDRFVHQLFEEQVELTPDAIAVICEGRQLTYRELNEQANRFAHHLRSLGVGPESLIGVMVERSLQMVVGLLGILKAGGGFLPLDPAYPRERLAFMMEDAGVDLLLSQQSLKGSLPEHNAQVIWLDSDWQVISTRSAENPATELSGDNLAYVIYTSGSTGRPKGIGIGHAAFLNFITDMRRKPGLSPEDMVLSVTTLSFDPSLLELFLPLSIGARILIASREAASDPSMLTALLNQHEVTVMQATPVTWRMLIDAGWQGSARLRVLCGGEALTPVLAEQLTARSCEVWNIYGPTETTVWSATWLVTEGAREMKIGRPIANMQYYVLDKSMQVVPIGVNGELYIGGEGLGRGYLKRADLTAERFIPNPFGTEEGQRLYRTGDLVKWDVNGELEYVGRIDNQVKVRGFRIELGEIEATLDEEELIKECAVVAREDVVGDKRLVAYVVVREGEEVITKQLRERLQKRLPEYMVPSAFVVMQEMPLTPSGKIDRKQLPAPEYDREQLQKQYVEPRTPVEEVISGIWREALGVKRVGSADNFFELGGHSLLATRIISRVNQAFNVELPLRRLFDFPTVASLATGVEVERKAEEPYALAPPLLAISHDGQLPLSFAQQRMWFLDQLEPNSDLYNVPAAMRLVGSLDIDALTDALNEVVRRHESLRTSFVTIDGKPVQVISPSLVLAVPVVDLSEIPEAEREDEARRLARAEGRRPFKLDQAPLLRATLLRLASDEHVVLLTMHHIVSDGWSMNVLVREVAALYEAYALGKPSPLTELPVQYADFAAWQQEWLQGEVLDRQIDYWKRQLAGAETVNLPTDRVRPPVQSYEGARYCFELPPAVVQQLHQLSQREAATLFMTLLAVFKSLLYRYTDQNDISVGTPIAGRTRLETEPLIGFFVNTLVLRTQVRGAESFRELLQRIRDLTLEAHAHQDVPFEKLVEELQPERDLSRTPLFQIAFTLQKSTSSMPEVAGLTLRSFGNENTTAKVDLSLDMHESEGGVSGTFEYNTDLFDGHTIARMAAHFQSLVAASVNDPDELISQLPLMTSDERRLQWEMGWVEARQFSRQCVHQLFEEQVKCSPDAIAIIHEDEQVTYGELNKRVNQLARYLRRQGVGPEVPVGIMVERSTEMVVGLLGILKAGGAYLPLDPAYPQERLAFMLADTGATLLLAHEGLVPAFVADDVQVLCLDTDWQLCAAESDADLNSDVEDLNGAYIIYTSGSTGRPKGVTIEHRSLTNYIQGVGERFALQPDDRMLQFFSLSFDAIAEELYSCLTRGATLVLRTTEMMATPFTFLKECGRRGITILDLPVAYWHELSANLSAEDWAQAEDLRLVAIGGEEAMPERFAQWQRAVDERVRLINTYGPTEATIIATMYELSRGADAAAEGQRRIPIGRPVENVKAYILDRQLRPVPLGVIGELYLGGVALARGYLNQPVLTAEKFIPDAFSGEPGARLYQTGDLVRYLPDGNIEFRGRRDHQVKVRGFRVELGEVETAIVEHPLVREAVVIARDESRDKRLVAYVVPAASEQLTTGELRNFLKQAVPHYMLPSTFIFLDALPLLPNGKLDRRALPAPDHLRPDLEREYVAPRDAFEQQIAAIWEEVLGVEGVGVHDNFFDLGGHSLLATQVVSRVRSVFETELPLRRLFETPTVEGLALAVTLGSDDLAETPFSVIERTSRGSEELLLDRLEQLSDEEVELLLPSILAEEEVADEQQY